MDDAKCRRCDDSGVVPRERGWIACTCQAGAVVLEQLDQRQQANDKHRSAA